MSRKPNKQANNGAGRNTAVRETAPAGNDRLFKLAKVCIILLLLFVAYQFGRQYVRYLDVAASYRDYQAALQTAQEEYTALETQKALINDDFYIERLARKIGLVKQGEIQIRPAKESEMPLLNPDLNSSEYNH